MGGGYISCDEFMGEDKSGSALAGVLRGIPALLPDTEAAAFAAEIAGPLLEALDEGGEQFEISPETVSHLIEPLTLYHDHLSKTLGHPDPNDAPALDKENGVDPLSAKYSEGHGWQFYCTHDLLQACHISQDTGAPIIIFFD